jgi:uncharacterized membrane protein
MDHLFVTAAPPAASSAFLEQDVAAARDFVDGKLFGSGTCACYAASRSLRSAGRPKERSASTMTRIVRWPLGVVVGFLALIGIGASATFYLREPYNPGFLDFPTIVALHVILGGVYLLFAPFQFVKRIRSHHIGYHRRAGRVLVAVGLVVGASALFMGLIIPFSGWAERAIIGLFGSLFLVALIKGFVYVRTGRVALHREWMIRAFAIGLSIATQRLIFVPTFFAVADPTLEQVRTISAAAFLAAFVVHAGVAEAWIRLTRKRRVPKASSTGAAHDPTPGSL